MFAGMLMIAIMLGYSTEANLPWWGLLLAIGLAVVMVLPIGNFFFLFYHKLNV